MVVVLNEKLLVIKIPIGFHVVIAIHNLEGAPGFLLIHLVKVTQHMAQLSVYISVHTHTHTHTHTRLYFPVTSSNKLTCFLTLMQRIIFFLLLLYIYTLNTPHFWSSHAPLKSSYY